MNERVILARYGEIGLKGKNRRFFERTLLRRVREALPPDLRPGVSAMPGRIYVRLKDQESQQALTALSRVFGLVSFSVAVKTDLDMAAIEDAAVALARRERDQGAATFKVEARRPNKAFPLTSPEVARHLGGIVAERTGLCVDVHRPDVVLSVELRERAYLYGGALPGPGGLPVGSSGRGLLMLSGGIDSPVAGWMGMKRGLQLSAVYFHSPPFTGEKAREKVIDLARVLARHGDDLRLHTVHFTRIQEAIWESGPEELGTILMRRFMVRIADLLAEREHAGALLTGENLGQVASQTLASMHAIGSVAQRPILRPLVGFDKAEIVTLAQRIGSYEISIRPYLDCCSVFVPERPATQPRVADAERAESRLPVDELVRDALKSTEVQLLGP